MSGSSPVATGAAQVFGDLREVADRVRRGLDAEIPESGEDLPPDLAAAGQIGRFAERERARVLGAGVSGLEKMAAGREDEIDEEEYFGVEAIVLLEGRPAILVQGQDFPSQAGDWAVLDGQREGIRTSIARVGRVEVEGHPGLDWLGTAFLVGPDVVMTNRHVAAEFSRGDGEGWSFRQGMSARLDLAEELGAGSGAGPGGDTGAEAFTYGITEVVGIHPRVDMALLRIGANGNGPPATPLAVAAEPPADVSGRPVYVIGYPAADGRRNEPEAMRRIFMDVYNVKRLQPGMTTGLVPGEFTVKHDCSTLGGNSGSPVFDLADHRVLGLHYGGRYGLGNFAVPLWELQGDPLLGRAQVNWV
ncbi:trypsin-like serine peptidase [Streptomyces goshikiensis]|uniref:trypsin-like serine peptidase n=1 Tax=Streptomyces goshikiensis TaxID=1942 RepID=UPI0036CF5E99